MKKRISSVYAVLFLLSDFVSGQGGDQNDVSESKFGYKVTADIVSSYVWRGSLASPLPNIQPTLALTLSNFEAGVWGSADFSAEYREIDPYISLTTRYMKFTITDYCWTFNGTSYFNYKNASTNHIIEGSVAITFPDIMPLTISLNSMFYGADKKWYFETEDFSSAQNYSTYIELGYAVGQATFILGLTPANGMYGAGYGKTDGFGVCNIGATASRNLTITPSFALPVKGGLFINPQASAIQFVFGITL